MNALELWRGRRVVLKVEELVGISGVGYLWEVLDMGRSGVDLSAKELWGGHPRGEEGGFEEEEGVFCWVL